MALPRLMKDRLVREPTRIRVRVFERGGGKRRFLKFSPRSFYRKTDANIERRIDDYAIAGTLLKALYHVIIGGVGFGIDGLDARGTVHVGDGRYVGTLFVDALAHLGRAAARLLRQPIASPPSMARSGISTVASQVVQTCEAIYKGMRRLYATTDGQSIRFRTLFPRRRDCRGSL